MQYIPKLSMLKSILCLLGGLPLSALVQGAQYPYERRFINGSTPADEENDLIPDHFLRWLKASVVHRDVSAPSGGLSGIFELGEKDELASFDDLYSRLASHHRKPSELPKTVWDAIPNESADNMTAGEEAQALFSNLGFDLAPECVDDKTKYWYRSIDGSCNWLRKGSSHLGSTFQPRSRDFGQHTYSDGISSPREGPNPRALSNAFFKRKERLSYEHTPLMLGLVEWLMHDVSYSEDAIGPQPPAPANQSSFGGPPSPEEYIDVPIPAGDEAFDPQGYGNRTFRVWRTKPAAGTGTSRDNPREHENGATAWLDASALYGSKKDVADALRTFKDGKLKSQIGTDGREYLPFNNGSATLNMRTRPGIKLSDLFMGGDPRTNEDWIMLSVHTLLLREHNRLCDILVSQHSDWDDERIYQTIRLVMSSKMALIGNSYQMAYWNEDMPWPRDDGFPLYRAMYAAYVLEINPVHSYPWPLVTRSDRPMVTSAEMAIVYRFHEFIINNFPLKDAHNNTLEDLTIFSTGFDSPGFLERGADVVLRGMLATDIPYFKSGVDETFRSAGRYRGAPLDLVVWSIVHEREQGLPTFNQYFRGYAGMQTAPALTVKIRERFEDFSSDPEAVALLKKYYKTPDDVDFVVGVQLEEQLFPGTTMPISALIPSLFSLFGVGNSDRFSPGFAVMRCILVDKPWNCRPSNALEELIWTPKPTENFPNARWFDSFWMKELDFQAHGTNLLFRLITENSGAKCVQKNPLFPYDPATNPILCEPDTSSRAGHPTLWQILSLLNPFNIIRAFRSPYSSWSAIKAALGLKSLSPLSIAKAIGNIGFTGLKFLLDKFHLSKVSLFHMSWEKTVVTVVTIISGLAVLHDFLIRNKRHTPPINWGKLIVGVGQDLSKDPVNFLLSQQQQVGYGKTFGVRLFGSLLYFIAGNSVDIDSMKYDELRASFHALSDDTQLGSTVGRKNFKEELHASTIRQWLEDRRNFSLPTLGETTREAVMAWLSKNSLDGENVVSLQIQMLDLMAHVMSRSVSGPDRYDDPSLIKAYKGLNKASTTVFGTSNLLPRWLAVIFSTGMTAVHWWKIKRVLRPVVKARRKLVNSQAKHDLDAPVDDLLTIFVRATDDDNRVVELVGGIVIGGLINVASAVHNSLYDSITVPHSDRLKHEAFDIKNFWRTESPIKAAVFESLRLSACIFGPVRKIVVPGFKLASDETLQLPKNSGLAASPYLAHYDEANYEHANQYDPSRFDREDPAMGTSKYLTFGLPAHTCPGRFFAVQAVSIAVNELLRSHEFEPSQRDVGGEGYEYRVGDVVMVRKPFALNIKKRHSLVR